MRVVVFTTDLVGRLMAGPGMRAVNFARELADEFDVTLIARFDGEEAWTEPFARCELGTTAAREAAAAADWLIGQPTRHLFALRKRQRVAFDLFDPLVLELEQLYGERPTLRQRVHQVMERRRLRRALREGDLLIAATPQQETFYRQIDASSEFVVVPFGAEVPPSLVGEKDDPPMILWSGGIWAWLDPLLAIEGVEEANRRGTRCHLTFFGGSRPSGFEPHARFLAQVREVARDSRFVTWRDEWVPYAERWQWLARAKVAIMLHRRTSEADASIRTRMFDAMAAGVPVITSAGGYAADLTRSHGLGIVVEPGDRTSVVEAIVRLVSDDGLYRRSVEEMRRAAEAFRWPAVVEPLVRAIRTKE